MTQVGDLRYTPSGQFRFRLKRRMLRDPLVVLQLQQKIEKASGYYTIRWLDAGHRWRDVEIEDLTSMSLNSLISPREGTEFPICFKPVRKLFGWCLALQVCDGAYQDNNWRPARMQDLLIKDGKITGGLGLVRR